MSMNWIDERALQSLYELSANNKFTTDNQPAQPINPFNHWTTKTPQIRLEVASKH